jgi:DNA processing protein
MARDLAQAVARMGGVVVSGMAHGIDTAAHLAAPGRTVAVLGQGLGAPLASSARRTADEILRAGGLLLSEFLPTCPPARHTFPQRNRVIAGLADVTVVVEASRRSGASITARQALEAGREVGAVPGSPYARASAGCLSLLFQGAALIRGPEDLLSLLSWDTSSPTPDTTTDPLLAALDQEGTPFDTLMDRLGICAAELGAGLGALELQGRIRRLPGDRFIRIR